MHVPVFDFAFAWGPLRLISNDCRYKEGVASFIERRTPNFDNYDISRPLIQKANEYFEPRGANLLGKL